MINTISKEKLRSMFRTDAQPVIGFSLPEISIKAQEMVGKLSISGAQPKLSVSFDRKKGELIVAPEKGEYILKPPQNVYLHLPENEQCCMDIAEELGIDVPDHCLLPLADGNWAYVVKRFDRAGKEKVHQEDFSQILGKEKYKGSIEEIGRRLREISAAPGLDVQLLFERAIMNFLIGNGDAHLKNFSVQYKNGKEIRLSPAYDIVSSKLVIPKEEDSALAVNGKHNKLVREDFDSLADHFKVPLKVRYEKFGQKKEVFLRHIRGSRLNNDYQERMMSIVEERFARMGFE